MHLSKKIVITLMTGIVFIGSVFSRGYVKWSFETGDMIVAAPSIGDDGTVYIGSSDGILYAINPDSTLKWLFHAGGPLMFKSPSIGASGSIYISGGDTLYAINPDGSVKWTFGLTSYSWTSAAIGLDETLFIGSGADLCAIDLNGTENWSFHAGDQINSPAIDQEGNIYFGSWDHSLYAVSPDGLLKWTFTTGDQIWTSPVIDLEGTIYIGSWDHYLYAVNPDSTLKWSYQTNDRILNPAVIGNDGTVYISTDYKLIAINPDGTDKWIFSPGELIACTPVIAADSMLYASSFSNSLFAVNLNGEPQWSLPFGLLQAERGPALSDDGTLYIGSHDAHLYAIQTSSPGLAECAWPRFGQNNKSTARAVKKAPIRASFITEYTDGSLPVHVQFIDHSTGEILEWEWIFGDGETSHEQHPSHAYTLAGTFTVTLIVKNDTQIDTTVQDVIIMPVTIVHLSTEVPATFRLSENYPNPFNSATLIGYFLPKSCKVTLKIFNIMGKEKAVLVDEFQSAGSYQVTWSAPEFPSGNYVLEFQADSYKKLHKMVLIK
jgi:outer membrane protein assembly factor BamB